METIAAGRIPPGVDAGPFFERQRQLGATFYEDYGVLWAATFGDPLKEYAAVRSDVGVWDTSGLVKFHITGSDTLPALDRLFTRSLRSAEPGLVRYGLILNADGLMLDEATVVVISTEEAYLFGNDGQASFLHHMTSSTDGMDVRFADVGREIASLAIQGPRSFEVVEALASESVESLRWFRCTTSPIELFGVSGLVVRAGFTGELGYEFYLTEGHEGAEDVWDAVVAAGATPIGLDAIEKLRIEAGLVIAEEDYFPGTTDPLDVGLERFIDLKSPGFIGHEAVSARSEQPSRRFVTITVPGAPPSPGTPIVADGAVVGDVRSADSTPRFGTLALGVIDAEHSAPGTHVEVDRRVGLIHAVPIDDPQKVRPRSDPRHPTVAS